MWAPRNHLKSEAAAATGARKITATQSYYNMETPEHDMILVVFPLLLAVTSSF